MSIAQRHIIKLVRLLVWFAFATTLWVSVAEACVICVPYPETTHADYFIDSEVVVAARENPDKPFSYRVVDVLKGESDKTDIDLFLNTSARRKLALNSKHVVILVRANSNAEWRQVSYATAEYQAYLRKILIYAAEWREPGGNEKRAAFFAKHLLDADRSIREQAYLEVGRASYAQIKAASGIVPREQIRLFLADVRLVEWHSLYILMLGQSRYLDDREYIKNHLHSAAKYHSETNLSAWVTAYVESNPDTAIDFIESTYFRDPDRTVAELTGVLEAMFVLASVGGGVQSQPAGFRYRLIESYAVLLDFHPDMAGWVAKNLTTWQRSALVDRLTEILDQKLISDPASEFSTKYYLSQADRFLPLTPID